MHPHVKWVCSDLASVFADVIWNEIKSESSTQLDSQIRAKTDYSAVNCSNSQKFSCPKKWSLNKPKPWRQ